MTDLVVNSQPQTICLRMPNWIGDAVMALPALTNIKQAFPEASLILASPIWSSEIYHFTEISIEKIIKLRRNRIKSNVSKYRENPCDIIFYFTNSFSTALEGFLAGIKKRVGYNTDCRGFLLTHSFQSKKIGVKKHQIDYYLDLLRIAGMPAVKRKPELIYQGDPPGILLQCGWKPDKLTLGISAGAAYGSAKRWLPQRFRSVIQTYINRGYQIVLFGSASEKEELIDIIPTKVKNAVINLIGKTSLSELIKSISKCDLFLTNDSGPMHIASALGISLVAIFGPTDVESTSPIGGVFKIVSSNEPCAPCMERSCPLKHHNCMKNVSIDMVVKELHKLEGEKE